MQKSKTLVIALDQVFSIKWSSERGENLHSIRLRRDIGLSEVCRQLSLQNISLSRESLRRMESDPKILGVSPQVAQGLCYVFEIDLAELLGIKSQPVVILGLDDQSSL